MPSISRQKFLENRKDIERLIKIHSDIAGDERGRKWGVEVLNKSAVVLVCAIWEAYVEDVIQEGLAHLCARCADPNRLPPALLRIIADEIKRQSGPNPTAAWKLAANGWKTELQNNLTRMQAQFVYRWNTPKTQNVDDLVQDSLGLASVSSTWHRKSLTVAKASRKLDDYVQLRGDIAHRLNPGQTVNKWHTMRFLGHVERLVEFTDSAINEHLRDVTTHPLF